MESASTRFAVWIATRDALYARGGIIEKYARVWAEDQRGVDIQSDYQSLTAADQAELGAFHESCVDIRKHPDTFELWEQLPR